MRTDRALLTVCSCLALAMIGRTGLACGGDLDLHLNHLALEAVSEDEAVADAARVELRRHGRAGLDALRTTHERHLDAYHAHLRALLEGRDTAPEDHAWTRLRAALDAVGGQRDNFAAPLFWHTDLETAQRVARADGRPVLSLRLLGRLDEEYSCANSRFFRTVLYANEDVARELRDRFVLHWQSVRPVPRITIDFGDGRRLERTITGNSAHLVLDAEGRPIDVIPGLYGPAAFVAALRSAADLAALLPSGDDAARARRLRAHHRAQHARVNAAWRQDLASIGNPVPLPLPKAAHRPGGVAPNALMAAPIAKSKMGIERPMLMSLMPDPAVLEATTDDAAWTAIAARRIMIARLDAGSRLVIAKQRLPLAPDTDALETMIEHFETSIALDTVRNEYLLHRTIHSWFADDAIANDADAVTARVYDELFLTPDTDPWLGLAPADVYAALDGDGLVCN